MPMSPKPLKGSITDEHQGARLLGDDDVERLVALAEDKDEPEEEKKK